MLVDDKLAKEKLARICEDRRADLPRDDWIDGCNACIEAIRNTDLTDCQPQQKAMNEHSSGTRATVPPSATASGTPMDDLEMTARCANAMGYASVTYGTKRGPGIQPPFDTVWVARVLGGDHLIYQVLDGLFADSQAMALVKKFRLVCFPAKDSWRVTSEDDERGDGSAPTLNGAIVRCVAAMQVDGTAQETPTVARRNEQDAVAAPDQGSVRNATDRPMGGTTPREVLLDRSLEQVALHHLQLACTHWSSSRDTKGFIDQVQTELAGAYEGYVREAIKQLASELDAAIRALPDQKD